jgi:hypothetical protein
VNVSDPLLYPVFNYLRRNGVPLGVDEYVVAVELLRNGQWIDDYDQLKRLCRLLWTRSTSDQELLEVAFAELLDPTWSAVASDSSVDELPPPLKSSPGPADTGPASPPSDDGPKPREEVTRERHIEHDTLVEGPNFGATIAPFELRDAGLHPISCLLTPRYPLTVREMAAGWRQFRTPVRAGPPVELDVEGTLRQLARTGLLLEPKFLPRRLNRARVVLLIDRRGSMTPFEPLVEDLVSSAARSGLLGGMRSYYFHDVPEGFVFEDKGLYQALDLEELLSGSLRDESVLIVSDAGAARGYYDERRVHASREFLKQLADVTHRFAWLNPVPRARWKNTSAHELVAEAAMFPLDRDGLHDAICILRGQVSLLGGRCR